MDCCQDVELLAWVLQVLARHLAPSPLLEQLSLHHVLLSVQLNQRRVRRQVRRQDQDLHQRSFWWQQFFSQLLSLQASSLQPVSHLDRAQEVCAPPVLLQLMKQSERIRPSLGVWQELPCSPYRVV
jgi:hypothetical protein